MTFGQSVKTCFGKYATFSGRASRSEYWWFCLFNFIIGLLLGWIPVLGWIISIALFLPGLAVGARRLHDTGRSALNLLWLLLPFVGAIILIVFYLGASQGDNQYGLAPVCNTEE